MAEKDTAANCFAELRRLLDMHTDNNTLPNPDADKWITDCFVGHHLNMPTNHRDQDFHARAMFFILIMLASCPERVISLLPHPQSGEATQRYLLWLEQHPGVPEFDRRVVVQTRKWLGLEAAPREVEDGMRHLQRVVQCWGALVEGAAPYGAFGVCALFGDAGE
ncbi:hypothetical protein QQZ08_004164 [Neonectria magnoliae]|uniref:Uncharacterized protein n=1 Tax=Neonectria magnoliae TaxID=2732573 RepID=A0ABR1I8X4_9HYPO